MTKGGVRRWYSLGLLAFVLAALIAPLLPLFAHDAYAHAALVRANPANNETLIRPPARVTLSFTEGVERRLTTIEVYDNNETRVDEGDMAFDDNDDAFASVGLKQIEPGLYFVRWSNVSTVDGHNLRGSYPFIVLNLDGTFPEGISLDSASAQGGDADLLPKNLDIALKWIALLSLATIGGMAFYVLVVLRPAAAFLGEDDQRAVRDEGERWLTNFGHVLLPASFIAAAFLLLLTVSRFATDVTLWEYLTSVRVGEYRGAGLLALMVALAGVDFVLLAGAGWKRTTGIVLVVASTAASMLTYALISHSATGPGKFWAIASDFVHLAASATWLGALVMLPLLMWQLRKRLGDTERFLYLANMFDRFSIMAGISVIVVMATGLFNGLAAIPSWDALTDTTYGRVLIAKLVLIAPLLGVAGFNAFVLKPRLVSAIDATYQHDATREASSDAPRHVAQLQRWLPRTILVEILLLSAVFAAVGVLTQTSTAESEVAQEQAEKAAAQKFTQSAEIDGVKLTLQVTPNQVGLNEYSLVVQTSAGTPLTSVTQARLRFDYEEVAGAVAPSQIILNRFGDGDFRSAGAYFTQPGNWRVEASVRRTDGDDISRTFVLPVARPAEQASAGSGGAFSLPFTSFTWNEVGGALLVLGGIVLVIYRREIRTMPQPAYGIAMGGAVAAMLAGGVLAFGAGGDHGTPLSLTRDNPIAPSAASVESGRALFQQNCIVCHGIDGRGDGPGAAALNPAPTDFRLHTPLHTDVQFYNFIADGYPGSAMPAFRDQFSEEDIWNLVNYLRAAFSEAPTE